MKPIQNRRRQFKLRLNPTVYEAFKAVCKAGGYGRANRAVEDFMVACLKNRVLLAVVKRLAGKNGWKMA